MIDDKTLLDTYAECGGNGAEAARRLGVSKSAICKRLGRLGARAGSRATDGIGKFLKRVEDAARKLAEESGVQDSQDLVFNLRVPLEGGGSLDLGLTICRPLAGSTAEGVKNGDQA